MKKISKMTIEQISSWLENNSWDEQFLRELMNTDSRRGVHELVKKRLRNLEKEKEEEARLTRMLSFEKYLWDQGLEFIAGIDEAGKGPLAGPVVAAAVILPKNKRIKKVNDSKQLAAHVREELFAQIKEEALDISCGVVDVSYIDTYNIYYAGLEAMKRAVTGLKVTAEYLLTDAYLIPGISIPQKPIKKGDTKSLSIASASIVAKVTRDKIMEDYEHKYPQYGFSQHKGYPTLGHLRAIEVHGLSPIHRLSFNRKHASNRKILGQVGEKAAKEYLGKRGYVIDEENFTCPQGEIDIIAREGNYLVFIEVRTRSSNSFGEPFESINSIKQRRIVKLAQLYMLKKNIRNCNVRFDVVSVLVDKNWKAENIILIKNAFY